MEPYSAAGGVVPRMLITCGHELCEGCLDTMLHPLRLKHGRKQFGCPMYQAMCPIRGAGGRTANCLWRAQCLEFFLIGTA